MRYRIGLIAILLLALLAACNLSSAPQQQTLPTATPFAGGKPSVTIVSPGTGSEVVVNDEVLVSAVATDPVGVQRVQLIANGQIVKTVSSESPSGDATLNVLLDYTPRQEGTVTLQVLAYRGAVVSDPAQIQLVVRRSETQVTSTPIPQQNVPVINPNDPTCRILTNVGLNLRAGPGTNYSVITVLAAGTVAPIIGRIGSNEWWQVRVNTTIGWVSAAYTTVYGNCGGIAVVSPPPTPTGNAPTSTPPPTFTPIVPTATPTVTPTPGPADLIISNISGPQTLVLPGGETQVTGTYAVTITNTGASATGQFNNVVIRTPGDVEIPLGVVASLDRNQSIIITVDISFDATGDYVLMARADNTNQISNELSEVNNAGIYNVRVSSTPLLNITLPPFQPIEIPGLPGF